jgi:PII-like signaling protein
VNEDCLKLTTYISERDRVAGNRRFAADALLDLYARNRFATSVLLRGTEGFGGMRHVHTGRLLTLSEDLPVVSVAVDAPERIAAALPEVSELTASGLVTLERARLLSGQVAHVELPQDLAEATKLTIYCGRHERIGSRPAFVAVVELLHRHGAAGATVLLGVDGTAHGARHRARFFAQNARVPLMIISVGDGERIAQLLPELGELLAAPLFTFEKVRVCKRDGQRISEPDHVPDTDASGLPVWQKLMVYAGEQAKVDGRPVYLELIDRLRRAGARGATALRGIWGYHGDHRPHGDKLLSLRRHVPVLTVIIDEPASIRRWFEIVDQVTVHTGLVTSELVLGSPLASGIG